MPIQAGGHQCSRPADRTCLAGQASEGRDALNELDEGPAAGRDQGQLMSTGRDRRCPLRERKVSVHLESQVSADSQCGDPVQQQG
jgi:hypothetical protein